MTPAPDLSTSAIWRRRRLISRVGLTAATVLLVTGLAMAMLDRVHASVSVLVWACAILVSIPVLNVAAVLAEEVRRREWRFAAATGVVILLLVYSVVTKVLMRQ